MPRDPIARMHADRRDLSIPRPDAGVLGHAFGADPQRRQRSNENLFDLPQIPMKILLVSLEVEDRIADELSWAMEGDVAAALDLEDLHAELRELRRVRQQV